MRLPRVMLVPLAVVFYAFCSASMLFLNKLAVDPGAAASADIAADRPRLGPGPVSLVQLVFATVVCLGLQKSGLAEVGQFTKDSLWYYTPYVLVGFVGSIYSSMQALRVSNVETMIVFRAATPLAVSFIEAALMGREAPSRKSLGALVAVAVATLAYVLADADFRLAGPSAYSWNALYYLLIVFEMTYGKFIIKEVNLPVWGSVLHVNALAIVPLAALSAARGDFAGAGAAVAAMPANEAAVLLLSCIVGTLIGFSGWFLRDLISATAYTVVGVACKMFTVVLAVLFLSKHASPAGLGALLVALVASSLYKQAPMRAGGAAAGPYKRVATVEGDDVEETTAAGGTTTFDAEGAADDEDDEYGGPGLQMEG